jgi:hypothetical protein
VSRDDGFRDQFSSSAGCDDHHLHVGVRAPRCRPASTAPRNAARSTR